MSEEIKVRDQAFYVEADRDNRKVVQSRPNTGTAYYKTDRRVSPTNYDGVLSPDGGVEIQAGTWFYSPTKARLFVFPQAKVETRRKFSTLLMWGHSYSWGAAGGGAPSSHFVPKVGVNLLGVNRIESRSVSGSRWTENKTRDGVSASTFLRSVGSSWVDMARYCHQRTHNWPGSFNASIDGSAYMFMHGCNDYGTLGVDAFPTFVNAAEFACHLALSRANWYESNRRDTTLGGPDVPVTGVVASAVVTSPLHAVTWFAGGGGVESHSVGTIVAGDAHPAYWNTLSGDAGAAETKTDRNTGTGTWAFTSNTVQRIQLPNWGGLAQNIYPGGVAQVPNPSATQAPFGSPRTVGVTFIIDPATAGTATLTNDRTGETSGPVSLSATNQTRPIDATYFPASLPAPKVIRLPNCDALDRLTLTITDITGKVQVDAFGIEALPSDPDAPLVIWNLQPHMLLSTGKYAAHSTPFDMNDETYDIVSTQLKQMLGRFPHQLVRAVSHEGGNVTETMLDTVHPDDRGNNNMVLNIRNVVAPGLPDRDALRPPAGDDEWRAFSASEDDYVEIPQANAFDVVPAAGFRRRLNGTIELRGVMGRDDIPVANDVIANLPQGFRPANRWVHFTVQAGHLTSDYAVARIRIDGSNGNIIFLDYVSGTGDAFPQFYLESLYFDGQQ